MINRRLCEWTHRVVVVVFEVSLLLIAVHTQEQQSCLMPSLAPGQCVVLDACPLLKAILNKPYLRRQEATLLIAASGACPEEQYCCERPSPTENPKDSEDMCLQSRLGSFVAAHSPSTPFGVFITSSKSKHTRCVGNLITPEYVLTAAHCIRDDRIVLYVDALSVSLIDDDHDQGLEGDVEPRYVREIIIHEQYSRTNRDHDIALLRLNETISQGGAQSPRPICIPLGPGHDDEASVGQTLKCFGWGANAHGIPSETKQMVTLERISLGQCQERMDTVLPASHKLVLSDRNICTISITGHDAFAGYSGGPLMYQKDGVWFLIGIINYRVGSTNNEFPVVSINVQRYTDWILDRIRRST